MLINLFVLALSSSIDSFGIGITYGLKGTSISRFGKIVLFSISFIIAMLSLLFGNIIKLIFPSTSIIIVGSFILIFMGIYICYQSLKNKNTSFDFDSSNCIESKEAFFLSLALSLDNFCIGIGGTIAGISNIFFPFTIAVFQLLFISLGNVLGRHLHNLSNLPNNVCNIISGILLILLGIIELLF